MYIESKSFRKTIDRLIQIAQKEGYNFKTFDKGSYRVVVGYFEEIANIKNMNYPKA